MYFIKELRESSHIIIHAEIIRKNKVNLLENYHSSSEYILTGSCTTFYRTLVNKGRKQFSNIQKSEEFRISINEFRISVNEFQISKIHLRIFEIHLWISENKLNYGYPKFIYGYPKFIYGYPKFIYGYPKFIYGYPKFI